MLLPLAGLLMLFAQAPDPTWSALAPLVGEWVGDGSGAPGQGTGEFSFQFDLQNRVLIRRSYAAYPKTADRPAFRHDDLLVIYRDSPDTPPRAVYFDNEGHVIHYAVSADGGTIQFLSDTAPKSPRFRFTYAFTGKDTLKLKFEIAPPGKPDAFAPYIDASAHRKP